MPVRPTHPGVYVEEVPSPVRAITGVSTATTAVVGYTKRGPTDTPIRCLNWGQFERTFGGLDRDSDVSYAVQQFFRNGGGEVYVVRVAKDAAASKVVLKNEDGTEVLTVEASSKGAWGDFLRLDVEYNALNPDSDFNLTVTRLEVQGLDLVTLETETHRNLSMDENSAQYVVRVVNATSSLVEITRASGLVWSKGYSLSGSLETFPTLEPEHRAIRLVLDGTDEHTLVLADPGSIDTVNKLKTAINTAISDAGLDGNLEVHRANALGGTLATGNFIRLRSTNTSERSAVRVVPAPEDDASEILKLGLGAGGREVTGASEHRPAATGTTSDDLADKIGSDVSGDVEVLVEDRTSGGGTLLDPASYSAPSLAATPVGPQLVEALQTAIRSIDHPATRQATVELHGTRLRILSSADTPNATLELQGGLETDLRLNSVNLQQYWLGRGADYGGQTDVEAGNGGTPPGEDTTGWAELLKGSQAGKTGLHALQDADVVNILAIPETTRLSDAQARDVIAEAVSFCERHRTFLLVDPPANGTVETMAEWAAATTTSKNAALFFPYTMISDPLDGGRLRAMPPSGTVAGLFARTDGDRGVWKAPAGIEASLRGVQALSLPITDGENGILNPKGVNCLRSLPVYGTVNWGARTRAGADAMASEWKYVPVRRLALFIEESLYRGTQWVVFEPNDEPLWSQVRLNVGAFMQGLFRQGAFAGESPRDAYFVKCDAETTPPEDRDRGIVNVLVGFAPLKPAEFVIIKISQITRTSES